VSKRRSRRGRKPGSSTRWTWRAEVTFYCEVTALRADGRTVVGACAAWLRGAAIVLPRQPLPRRGTWAGVRWTIYGSKERAERHGWKRPDSRHADSEATSLRPKYQELHARFMEPGRFRDECEFWLDYRQQRRAGLDHTAAVGVALARAPRMVRIELYVNGRPAAVTAIHEREHAELPRKLSLAGLPLE
jgi:hypothetical protein